MEGEPRHDLEHMVMNAPDADHSAPEGVHPDRPLRSLLNHDTILNASGADHSMPPGVDTTQPVHEMNNEDEQLDATG